MRVFALSPKPEEYSEFRFFEELLRLPESFLWEGRLEPIVLRLCPVAQRLAQRTNWPLLRQCWFLAWGVAYACPLRLEPR